MPKTLGFIGSGQIATSVAKLAVAAGLNVVLSNSRGPETLSELVAELGDRARAGTAAQAAQAGDLVVVALPLGKYRVLDAAALAGKIVIDLMNYYPDRDGKIAELDDGTLTSSTLVQRYLADSMVIKAFNSISYPHLVGLARPAGAPDRSALPVAGDDDAAKAEVVQVLDALGYDAVDVGALAESWRSEPNSPVYVRPYFPPQPAEPAADPYRWFLDTPGTPVPAARVKELTESAVRSA